MDVLKFMSCIMVVLGSVMLILCLASGEYQTAIWSANTAIWAGIANSLIDD